MLRSEFIAAQPHERVQQFAEFLGWRDLRVHAFERSECDEGFFVAYFTTDERFNLQIARRQDLGPDHYTACVVAERYGITAVPHQPFQLFRDPAALQAEASRLVHLLGRTNFKNPIWRRQFAEQFPTWIMMRYRRRNKFLNQIRARACSISGRPRTV